MTRYLHIRGKEIVSNIKLPIGMETTNQTPLRQVNVQSVGGCGISAAQQMKRVIGKGVIRVTVYMHTIPYDDYNTSTLVKNCNYSYIDSRIILFL